MKKTILPLLLISYSAFGFNFFTNKAKSVSAKPPLVTSPLTIKIKLVSSDGKAVPRGQFQLQFSRTTSSVYCERNECVPFPRIARGDFADAKDPTAIVRKMYATDTAGDLNIVIKPNENYRMSNDDNHPVTVSGTKLASNYYNRMRIVPYNVQGAPYKKGGELLASEFSIGGNYDSKTIPESFKKRTKNSGCDLEFTIEDAPVLTRTPALVCRLEYTYADIQKTFAEDKQKNFAVVLSK